LISSSGTGARGREKKSKQGLKKKIENKRKATTGRGRKKVIREKSKRG